MTPEFDRLRFRDFAQVEPGDRRCEACRPFERDRNFKYFFPCIELCGSNTYCFTVLSQFGERRSRIQSLGLNGLPRTIC
jgi:hypothetical protein